MNFLEDSLAGNATANAIRGISSHTDFLSAFFSALISSFCSFVASSVPKRALQSLGETSVLSAPEQTYGETSVLSPVVDQVFRVEFEITYIHTNEVIA